MRKYLVVAVVLFAVFVAVFRQRIFVRDPLGSVEKNGIAQKNSLPKNRHKNYEQHRRNDQKISHVYFSS